MTSYDEVKDEITAIKSAKKKLQEEITTQEKKDKLESKTITTT